MASGCEDIVEPHWFEKVLEEKIDNRIMFWISPTKDDMIANLQARLSDANAEIQLLSNKIIDLESKLNQLFPGMYQ